MVFFSGTSERLADRVKVRRATRQEIGHFTVNLLAWYQEKQHETRRNDHKNIQ